MVRRVGGDDADEEGALVLRVGGSPAAAVAKPVELALRPYHQWAERGATTMRVWLPVIGGSGAGA